jgi:hypothetical protein
MAVVVMLLGVLLFGPACLGLLLWLAHLEETLPRDVRSARRHPEPPPILSVPVRPRPRSSGVQVGAEIPEQRTVPAVQLSPSESVATT